MAVTLSQGATGYSEQASMTVPFDYPVGGRVVCAGSNEDGQLGRAAARNGEVYRETFLTVQVGDWSLNEPLPVGEYDVL